MIRVIFDEVEKKIIAVIENCEGSITTTTQHLFEGSLEECKAKFKSYKPNNLNELGLPDCDPIIDYSIWFDESKNYRLIANKINLLQHIGEETDLGKQLFSMIHDFQNQLYIIEKDNIMQIYLANLNSFNGINANDLIAGYPETFLRIENKA